MACEAKHVLWSQCLWEKLVNCKLQCVINNLIHVYNRIHDQLSHVHPTILYYGINYAYIIIMIVTMIEM